MDIILILSGIFIFTAAIFISIEFPYYLVSVFLFLHLYDFNLELPGPLDLRGLLSLLIFLRLIVFDKENLNLIRENLTNKFIVMILLFTLFSFLVDFFNGVKLSQSIKNDILNLVTFFIGFVTILSGKAKQTIIIGIFLAGIVSTSDLIFSYFYTGGLYVKRIVDILMGGINTRLNHNFFGEICGEALIVSVTLLIYQKKKNILYLILTVVFLLGILISTSRMTFISTFSTILVLLITQKAIQFNLKRVLATGFIFIVIVGTVAVSYTYILNAMNVESKFADQIHYRLIEEPLSIFQDDVQKYGLDDNKVQGTMRWRYYKILEDGDKFFNQNISKILFGFGAGGYTKIGRIQFHAQINTAYQYAAHNFYINTISEIGVVGLLIFLIFFFSLIYTVLKLVRQNLLKNSLVFLLLYMLFYTFGGDPKLTEKFGYLLYGAIIAEYILTLKALDENGDQIS
jgi:O-antigen ligase